MKTANKKTNDLDEILARLGSLEKRIIQLESQEKSLNITSVASDKPKEADSDYINVNFSLSAPFESDLGEYGLAWLGNIVFFFAITFLWQYFNHAGHPVLALMTGITSIILIFSLSHHFRKSYSYLSFTFRLFGFIISYYILLRLHFFNDKPLVLNQLAATLILLAMSGVQIFYAIKIQSQILAGLAFTMMLITAFLCDQKYLFLLISIASAGLAVYSFWKYNWWKAMIFIICSGFIVNLIWLLKNPVSLVNTPEDLTYHFTFVCFSVMAAIFSLVAFRRPDPIFPENLILAVILLAGLSYSAMMLILVNLHFPGTFVSFFIIISIYCIVYSIILKLNSPWKYSPALFALYGFVAISVTVIGTWHFPDSFLLLTIQSFLVLAIALWYRSHIITLMNTFLLVILALFYYKTSGTLHTVNFAIPAVAFLSARIINWQKERLNIKTDLIRNIYLIVLFFSILYATYKVLPGHYITISWLIITGIYFILSIILKNIKYRWMAMANLLMAAFHLFMADLAKIDLIFRILAFLAFAFISIFISTYYVRKLKKDDSENVL